MRPCSRNGRGKAWRVGTAVFLIASLGGCRDATRQAAGSIDLLAEPERLRIVAPPGTGSDGTDPVTRLDIHWGFERKSKARWKVRPHAGQARGERTTEVAHGGKHSYCLASVGGAADADARVHVNVRAGTRYSIEAHLRTFDLEPTTATVYGTLHVGEFSYTRARKDDFNDPVRWHRELPMLRGTSEGWRALRYELQTGELTRMLRIGLSLGSWGEARGKVCVDDLRVTELSDGTRPALGHDGTPRVQQVSAGGELRRAIQAYPSAEYRYALRVPARARLSFAVGIEDRAARDDADGVLFEVDVASDGETHNLFSRHVAPRPFSRDGSGPAAARRGWVDVDLPLAAYAGENAEIVLRTAPSARGASSPSFVGDLAAWANPVVYVPRSPADREREPNIFLITVDTLRADHLGCYGYGRDTSPAIDAFAAGAVLFENAFTTIPRTTPALASLMTGLYPRAHQLMTLLHALPNEQVTLAECLTERGYATGAIVTRNTSRESNLQQGFDTFSDHEHLWANDHRARAEHLVKEATGWIGERAGQKLFLWLHLWDPHFFYAPPPPYDRWFDAAYRGGFHLYERIRRGEITVGKAHFAPDLTQEQERRAVALYDGEIRYTDEWVGLFLSTLRDLGLYDDALIVFTADHGESLGEHQYYFEHGEYLYDGTLRIPLIVKFPHDRHKGLRVAGKTMIFDVMPTILAAAGGQLHDVAGTDLAVGLEGAREPHPLIYGETDRVFFPENPRRYVDGIAGNWKSVREGRLKLIEIPHPDGNLYELYDIVADPEEKANLYRTGHPDAERLTVALRQWLASFDGGEAASPRPLEIDEQTAERLRRLGYMNE